MRLQPRYSDIVLNLLVAIAISLVVNFSYLLLVLVEHSSTDTPPLPAGQRVAERLEEGVLRVHADGYGYLVYPDGDSVYVMQQRIRRLGLEQGDRLVADRVPRHGRGAHPVMMGIRMRNGHEFDYSALYNRPSETVELLLQLFYYVVVSFVILTILTAARRNYSMHRFLRCGVWALLAAVGLYFIAPVTDWHSGRIEFNFMSGRMLDYMLLLKCSFAVVVSMLYAHIYVLISQRQAIVLENERLKNENLTTRYNMLVGQINPHFFFNSLNSLAALVRRGDERVTLDFIDKLSDVFRYILQSDRKGLVTLDEELEFVDSFKYMMEVRFANKLRFSIDVDLADRNRLLPVLSLLPLIDNIVVHNTIDSEHLMAVSIRMNEKKELTISNPVYPKLMPSRTNGTGLQNLKNRFRLLCGKEVRVENTGKQFTVFLPL